MLFVDIKYAGLLANSVRNFSLKNTSPYLLNFSCPICGDGKKKNRARGYVYQKNERLNYKCHNCGFSSRLGGLLKKINYVLWKDYIAESYRERLDDAQFVEQKKTELSKSKGLESLDSAGISRLLSLESAHPARKYIDRRRIPIHHVKDLFYCERTTALPEVNSIISDDNPRILIPALNENKELVAVTGRRIGEKGIRYLTTKIKTDGQIFYGLHRINRTNTVWVLEGAFDAMLFPNAVACGNCDLKRASKILPKSACVLVFDNEPRNKEVVFAQKRAIEEGFKVVVWPEAVKEKDPGEMLESGINPVALATEHAYEGLKLLLEFSKWKKVSLRWKVRSWRG